MAHADARRAVPARAVAGDQPARDQRGVYFGLAKESSNTVLQREPAVPAGVPHRVGQYDVKAANALLDSLGLTKRDARGLRLLPDGRPMEIIVDTAGESTEETDVLELVRDSWRKLGIALFSRPS